MRVAERCACGATIEMQATADARANYGLTRGEEERSVAQRLAEWRALHAGHGAPTPRAGEQR